MKASWTSRPGLPGQEMPNIAKKRVPWQKAMKFCQDLEIGNQKGWRLPTKEELITLLDTSQSDPALPDGHPFKKSAGLGWRGYWTSTEYEGDSKSVWTVNMYQGRVTDDSKIFDCHIWPMLGDN